MSYMTERVREGIISPLSDLVEWDRYGIRSDPDGGFIFGWIRREDGNRDFVVINFQRMGDSLLVSYNTSSKTYSKEIGRRLGCKDDTYTECRSAAEIVLPDSKLVEWQKIENK